MQLTADFNYNSYQSFGWDVMSFYITDGADCFKSPSTLSYYAQKEYQKVPQVAMGPSPCISSPCCVIAACHNSNGVACSTNWRWEVFLPAFSRSPTPSTTPVPPNDSQTPTPSNTPTSSETPTNTPTPTSSLSNGASPSYSQTPTPSVGAPPSAEPSPLASTVSVKTSGGGPVGGGGNPPLREDVGTPPLPADTVAGAVVAAVLCSLLLAGLVVLWLKRRQGGKVILGDGASAPAAVVTISPIAIAVDAAAGVTTNPMRGGV